MMKLSRLKYLFNLISLRTIPYVQPSLMFNEWKLAFSILLGKSYPDAHRQLEEAVRDLTGSEVALGLNRARSGIQLALEAFDFPPKSEVILASFNCNDIIDPIVHLGLEPVFVDIDRDFNISAGSVRSAITPKTRCIIMPHLSGKYVEGTEEILSLAKANGIKVIDDASQAFGLVVDGKWAGTFGDVGIFSFGFGKTLFAPGGGMLLTSDKTVIEYVRQYKFPPRPSQKSKKRLMQFMWWYGLQKITFPMALLYKEMVRRRFEGRKYIRPIEPFKPKQISEMDAVFVYALTARWDEIVLEQQKNAVRMIESGVFEKAGFRAPSVKNHNFTKFLITTEGTQEETLKIKNYLRHSGIEIETSYTPLHLQPQFQSCRKVDLPETERIWQGAFWIPLSPGLRSSQLLRIEKGILQSSKQ